MCDDETNEIVGLVFCGLLMGVLLLAIILYSCGIFDSPIEQLDLDKDKLVEYQVLKYYPEYENCSFRFVHWDSINCDVNIHGVQVFCGESEGRDGMSVLDSKEEITLCLDKVELKDILENILEEYR